LSVTSPANARHVVDSSAKTVYDKVTGLTWQREPLTTGGDSGDGNFSWGNALAYCAGLVLGGQDDWRLPGIRELLSLVWQKTNGTAIDAVAFPNTPAGNTIGYWSATPFRGGSSLSWIVRFDIGSSSSEYLSGNGRVRCVR